MTQINSEEAGSYLVEVGPNMHAHQREDDIISRALEILAKRHQRGQPLTSPSSAQNWFRLHYGACEREVFVALFLDNRHRIIESEELFWGTVDGAAVYPREVVKAALAHNAAAVVFAHNHPSGVAEPSRADEKLTNRLRDALDLVDVRVLDHIIVSAEASTSLAERGYI